MNDEERGRIKQRIQQMQHEIEDWERQKNIMLGRFPEGKVAAKKEDIRFLEELLQD